MTRRTPFAYVTKGGKVVADRVLAQYAMKDDGSRALAVDLFEKMYNPRQLITPPYNPTKMIEHLEINTYHKRAVTTKARDTAGLGYHLQAKGEDPSEAEQEIWDVFDRDQSEPLEETLNAFMVDYDAIGYGTLEITRDGMDPDGPVKAIYHIEAHTIRVHASGNKYMQAKGVKQRWFKRFGYERDVHKNNGREYDAGTLAPADRASEIIWRRMYGPKSQYYGMPDHIPALGAMLGDLARRDYNIEFFDNFGVPAYAVFITGDFDPGEVDEDSGRSEFAETIETHFEKLAKTPHSTLVLTIPTSGDPGAEKVDVEFVPLSTDTKEASFRLYRNDNRDEVLAAHGVPPYRAGIAETGSLGGSVATETTNIYKTSVINPRQTMLEWIFNGDILPTLEIEDWEFRLEEIDTTDEAHEMEMAGKLFERGAMSPNDLIRAFGGKYGVEPVDHPAMDAHFVNGQAIDLELDIEPEVFAALSNMEGRLVEIAAKAIRDGEATPEDILAALKQLGGDRP